MNERVADTLDRQYRIAVAVVAVLVLGNGLWVQPYMLRLMTDAPLINTAARQRMLSQRLAKAAMAVEGPPGPRKRAYVDEMKDVLKLWSTAHEQLVRGDGQASRAGRNTSDARKAREGLEPYFVRMRDAARQVIRADENDQPDAATVHEGLGIIRDNEGEYLQKMDRVVGLYEREARGRIDRLRWISLAATGLTLATILAIGRFILRPASGLIRRQISELGQARDDLEDRVRERTRELEAANERHRTLLEQFSHVGRTSAIGEMASSLAHELKQPLGAIANYAEGCLIALKAPDPELGEVRSVLERLLAATMCAGRIIEQVRRFVTRHEPTREPFDPNTVVKEVAEILGVEAEQRGITLTLDTAPSLLCLWGNSVQVQQVLVNLVRNAFESLEQSQNANPTLVISTRPDDGGGVEFTVTDNGEGVQADQIERIFDAYFSTRAGGMGMGLAISRTIVEAHGGRFFVESDPGARTTFRFILPAEQSDHVRPDGIHRG